MHEWAVREPQSIEHKTRSDAKEKSLVTLDLNLTFMQKLGSGSDPWAEIGWFFTNTQINMIGLFDWQYWGDGGDICYCTSCVSFCLHHWKEFVCKILQFSVSINIQDSSECVLHWFCFRSAFKRIWPRYLRSVFQRLKVSTNIKALLAVINCKDVFAILPTGHRKSKFIIIRLIPDVRKYLYLTGYSYPHCVIILVVCSEVSGGLSYSRTAKPWHFNKDIHVNEHHLLKEAYAFLFRSPKAFLQNVKWRYLLRI